MAIAARIKESMEKSSWVRKMFEAGAEMKMRFGAENVFDFSIGNPNVPPPADFQKALESMTALNVPNKHGYMPNAGYPDVRAKVASFISDEQGVTLGAESVIMTCGAGGGLNVALKTILNPGDKVLVNTPYFVEYGFYVDNHGGVLEPVPCGENFDLDLEALASRIDEKTAAVIINSPNNPSGKIYDKATIKSLGELLERESKRIGRTIYLLSDEPYRKIVFDGVDVPGIFEYYRNSMIVTSYSKDLSLPGERIGWLAVNPQADDFADIIAGAVLCNRILGYVNAPGIMQRVVGELQGRSVDIDLYEKKRDLLSEGLKDIGYDFLLPKGTFYLFPKAPGGDDLKVVEILRDEKILGVPGRGFGMPGYFRLSFCVDDSVIINSLPAFRRAMDRF
ncbi:MAG: pyridoxal phosphate-dependent aminotransferase [Spirochaetales bacterium]|nr:pyridoxal phosphate-dependent aminotransferase [Spirochaetales bacterium]